MSWSCSKILNHDLNHEYCFRFFWCTSNLPETSPIFCPNGVFQVFIVLEMYNFAKNIDREVDKTTSDDTVLVLRFTMKLTMKFPAIFWSTNDYPLASKSPWNSLGNVPLLTWPHTAHFAKIIPYILILLGFSKTQKYFEIEPSLAALVMNFQDV